jgi:tRNA (guanine-N7-)-methyltransferase
MAQKAFHLPPTPTASPSDSERQHLRSLVGGSIDLRRVHGKPTGVHGKFVLDPVFDLDHEAKLKNYCDAADPRPLAIEIGFQFGRFATAWCVENPGARFLGFEVRRKFCQDASARLEHFGVKNAWLALVDAREMMPRILTPGSVDAIFVFFPDPWWKTHQVKKRLLTPDFVARAALWLKLGGQLVLKTDVPGYAQFAEDVLRREPALRVEACADPRAGLPPTLRESRCMRRGEPTWAFVARRIPCADTLPADLVPQGQGRGEP